MYDENIDSIVGVFNSKYLIRWSLEPKQTLQSLSGTEPLIVYEFYLTERWNLTFKVLEIEGRTISKV